jgi:glycosyltransferase involved in cell wall biosynthesis
MNILLIHQNFVDPNHPGGTRHFELAKYLVQKGHRVTIVAGNVDYLTGQRICRTRFGLARQELHGVHVLRAFTLPCIHRSFGWRVVSFFSFMFSSLWAGFFAGPVDVVLGTSPPIFQLPSAWITALLRWRPFILEIRDLWPEFAIEMGIVKNRFVIAWARYVENFFYRRARHIIVNSPAYRDYLLGKGVPGEKISVIPNGVDAAMFRGGCPATLRRDLGLDANFLVTYAGALGICNDVETILRAAASLRECRDIHFLIVGGGKETARLQHTAQQLQLANVTFAGCFPKERMQDVLAAADACVATLKDIPMFRTTYPNKVFDYMAAGKPTILGIDGVIREVLEAAHGGIYVPPGNAEALASAVRSLRDDPELAGRMGHDAREYVRRHFCRRQQAENLEALLATIAG